MTGQDGVVVVDHVEHPLPVGQAPEVTDVAEQLGLEHEHADNGHPRERLTCAVGPSPARLEVTQHVAGIGVGHRHVHPVPRAATRPTSSPTTR